MASKKISKKTIKNVEKAAKKHKGLTIVIFFILGAALGFFGYNTYSEKSNYDNFINEINKNEIIIDEEIDSDIELVSKIGDYEVTWTSSDETTLTKLGVVNRPSYDDGNKVVTLTETIKYTGKTFLYDFIKDYLGIVDYVKEYKVTIKCKEASPIDYINAVFDNLVMPLETYQSIGFNSKTCYENVTLSFESSNKEVIDNTGKVTHPITDTIVTITVTAKANETSVSKDYNVTILKDEFIYDDIDNDFDSIDTYTTYRDITINEVNYHNAMVVDSLNATTVDDSETNEYPHDLKLRTNNKDTETGVSYIETKKLINPLTLSFKYKFDDSAHSTEKGKLIVYAKTNEEYEKINEFTVLIKDDYELINIDLSSYSEVQIKIEFTHTWAAESFVRIDDFKVTKEISQSEIEGNISIIANFSRSMFLPFTTKLGGSVTWKSSDESKITSEGTLIEGQTGQVTLEATIVYGSISFKETFDVTIKNIVGGSKDPLEIYFIDLGTYGLGDTGESTYIKYNDIDILVDGGDHFADTNKAVSEVFEAHTNDKVIDYLIITHPDSDHIGGLPYIFETYQVNNVYKFAEETFTTQKFKNLKAAYDSEPNCTVYDVYEDIFTNKTISENIVISDDIYLKFINTGHLLDKETNGRSLVFEIFAYDTVVLMTGDADNCSPHTKLESDYMDQIGDIDILKVVHHGTENGTSTEFLNQVKPEVAVICNGNYLGNKHSHPNKAPLERMNNYSKDLKIYTITGGGIHAELVTGNYAYKGSCTLEESKIDRNGTITCTITDSGYNFECALKDEIMDLRESQYWGILFN